MGLTRDQVVYVRSNTFEAPDSGTTSGSRQTTITGEACRRACVDLKAALEGKTLQDLEGREFYAEYLAKTDPLGAPVPNPVSHVAYGYATQVCILSEDGKLKKMVAAHDVGKAVNPISCEGQIEGGVVMSLGFALTEKYPLVDCKPTAKFGTLGLFRANQIPEIEAIVVEKPGLRRHRHRRDHSHSHGARCGRRLLPAGSPAALFAAPGEYALSEKEIERFETVKKPRRRCPGQSSGGCVRGAKSPPRVQSTGQRGENTFSTR